MIYCMFYFNPKNGKREKIENFIEKKLINYFEKNNLSIKLMKSLFGLSKEEYLLVVEAKDFNGLEKFDKLLKNEKFIDMVYEIKKDVKDTYSLVYEDIEKNGWDIKKDKIYHIEKFNTVISDIDFQNLFENDLFAYLREKDFYIKVLKKKHGLDINDYIFITEMDKVGDIDDWVNRTSSEAKGKDLMDKLVSAVDIPRASIVKNII